MTYILDSVLSQAVSAALPFFPYRCDLVTVPITIGTAGGQVRGTPHTEASALPLLYEVLRNPITRVVGGRETVVGTHKLYLEVDEDTSAITPDYEIHVAAYNDEPAKVFIRPIFLEGAFSHLIQLAAVLKDA